MPDDTWHVRESRHYREQVESRAYRRQAGSIEQRLDVLLGDPYTAAGADRLKHQWSGLRSARAFDALRFIYRICEECRKLHEGSGRWALDCCRREHTSDRTVNLLCLSEHYADDIPEDYDFDD